MQPTSALPPRPAARPSRERPVAVIGGGITGLAAAWHLHRAGIPVVLFEGGSTPGGVIASPREDGWLWETGPNTLFENTPALRHFIDDLGLGARRLEAAPAAKRRYVVHGGRPVALPDSPWTFLKTPLLSARAKLGLLGEPFRGRGPGDHDESVAEFVVRRLGPEFLDRIVNPFVAGVYAGDPAQLSVRHAFPKLAALEREHGSLLRGALHRRSTATGPGGSMISFPEGLAEIPRALAKALGDAVRTGHQVAAVRPEGAEWRIEFASSSGRQSEIFAAVICTLPPDALTKLDLSALPGAGALAALRAIPQPAVASVFLGYRRADVAHPLDGFGLLAPATEGRKILGTLFSSTLFPGRAPAGHVALTTFVGGTRQPELARADDQTLLASVQAELADLLGVQGAPVMTHIQRWPRAIPQYIVGFQRFEDACAEVEHRTPGFFIGGTCRNGVSLSHCLSAGENLAELARQRLATATLNAALDTATG
mgnify:CR=1 FL=1